MQRSLVVAALAAVIGCAATEGVNRNQLQNAFCNPCQMPCQLGCVPAAAAGPRVQVGKERLQLSDKVLFETDQATIDPRSHALLDQVAAALAQHPEVKRVVVEGHTDATGGTQHNLELSQARAEAVRGYLVQKGVAADRLEAQGFGESRPIADNTTAAGREANRRVDFVIPTP